MLLVVALTYKPFRSPLEELFEVKRQPAPFFDLSIWQNKAFCVYTAAVALFMLGYFIPYVHLVGSSHCFIPIPLGAPIVLFPPFHGEQPSICPLHPGSSHRFVSRTRGSHVSSLPLGTAIVLSPLCPRSLSLLKQPSFYPLPSRSNHHFISFPAGENPT